jgi:Flp pilus assembly pilin Flp|tara:strand:- start:105 stop:302 length:198 start_codon:yes stop_codon:yes gene_type:complete
MQNILNKLKNFRADEDGAVTVDYVVLTAAIVGLGILVGNMIWERTDAIAGGIETELEGVTVNTGG